MRELSRKDPEMKLTMELNAPAIARSGNTVDDVTRLLRELGFLDGNIVEAGYQPFLVGGALPKARATYNLFLLKRLDSPSLDLA